MLHNRNEVPATMEERPINAYIKNDNGFQYIEEGEGEVLLLLHGLFGTLSNWKEVLRVFSKDYRVIIPLLPIYHLPPEKTTVEGLNEFVYEFSKYKKLVPAILIGNSLGGHVALYHALEYPENVKALVLTGSSGLYENTMGSSFVRRSDYDFIKARVEMTFYDPKVATPDLVNEVYQTVNDNSKVIKILSMARSAMRQNLRETIKNIDKPVCLIWGRNDIITPEEVGQEFHQLLPNSELHFIDKCGHAPMMEHPQEFNRILRDFLQRHTFSISSHDR